MFCHVATYPADSLPRARDASQRDESNKAARAAETLHFPSQGNFIILGVSKHVPKTVTTAGAAEPSVSARRRLKSARQFVGSCAKGLHSAAQGRDASRRDESNKAARAPETWQSPSHWYFILSGTETCSQNGDHCLRSRTQRERAPTTKVCAAIRGVVRKGFTLSRTRPRRIAARRVEQSSARTRNLTLSVTKVFHIVWYRNMFPKR